VNAELAFPEPGLRRSERRILLAATSLRALATGMAGAGPSFAWRSRNVPVPRGSPLPTSIPAPPAFWEGPYAAMVATDELIWSTLAEITEAVSSFLNPVLGHSPEDRIWVPADWHGGTDDGGCDR
jgi:hypothetical protein